MEKAEVDAIRARSRAKNGPWATDYVEMGRKTPVRRLCKYLKLDPETQRLITEDERMDAAADAEVIDDGSARPSTVDALKNQLKDRLAHGLNQAQKAEPAPANVDEHTGEIHHVDDEAPWSAPMPEEDPFAETGHETAPAPERPTASFPANPRDWYNTAAGGIDLSQPPKSELALPSAPPADWINARVWTASMLKEWTPQQILHGGRNGKRHAALRGAVDYVKRRATPHPETALIAAWCLAQMQRRWEAMEAAGLDPRQSYSGV
jgi:hypothetical protein